MVSSPSIVNDQGELLAVQLTPGNIGHRSRRWIYGVSWSASYLSQALFEQRFARGLQLITPSAKTCRIDSVLEDKLLTA